MKDYQLNYFLAGNNTDFYSLSQFTFKILFKDLIYVFLEREEGRKQERERNINVWLPLTSPLLGTQHATQACALTGNRTSDPLVHRPALNPLSHTSQGLILKIFLEDYSWLLLVSVHYLFQFLTFRLLHICKILMCWRGLHVSYIKSGYGQKGNSLVNTIDKHQSYYLLFK